MSAQAQNTDPTGGERPDDDTQRSADPSGGDHAASAAEAEHRTDLVPDDAAEPFEPLAARAPVVETAPRFADLGVHPKIVEALEQVGITRTFAIQELTLPLALPGSDLIGQARTGTGKTLGFGVPLLQRITLPGEPGASPQALVVVPTRELCVQVTRDLQSAGSLLRVRCLSIYGGRAYEPQIEALRRGVDVVVGTPGRLLDLVQQRHLLLGGVSVLVLDEADEMLDLGFLPDIERILATVPTARQTMLFSATMPAPIVGLARQFLHQPTHVRAHGNDEGSTVPETRQLVYRAHAMDKIEILARILQARDRELILVFCRTKRTAARLAEDLAERGFAAAAVHGDLGQGAREQAMRAFRSGKVDVLIATDVAARGLDITGVSHVVNYQCPEDEKVYVHRIGRTGRAGGDGIAVTFVDWDDIPRWQHISTALGLAFDHPAETYSTSPHLYADLDIPESAKGTLPRSARTRAGLDAEQLEDVGETGRSRRPHPAASPDSESAERRPRRNRGPRRRSRSGEPIERTETVSAPADDDRAGRPADSGGRHRRGRGHGRRAAGERAGQPTATEG
ncbi:MAG: DEAD/DEAH box helicase [Pseudonocardiales bacterium]|nr:MAG: DEAD/DEAH box helicase [Pseudonocardiales bacterium]